MEAANGVHLSRGLEVLWQYIYDPETTEDEALRCLAKAEQAAVLVTVKERRFSIVPPATGLLLPELDFTLDQLVSLSREWRAAELVLVPVGNERGGMMDHWSLLVFDRSVNEFQYWDSQMTEGSRAWKKAKQVQAALEVLLQIAAGTSFKPIANCFQQTTADCGVIVCAWMERLCKQEDPLGVTSQSMVNDMRNRVVEIVRGQPCGARVPPSEVERVARPDGDNWVSIAFMNSYVDYLSSNTGEPEARHVHDGLLSKFRPCTDEVERAYWDAFVLVLRHRKGRSIPEHLVDAANGVHLSVSLEVLWEYVRDRSNPAMLDAEAVRRFNMGDKISVPEPVRARPVFIVPPGVALLLPGLDVSLEHLVALWRNGTNAKVVLAPVRTDLGNGIFHWSLLQFDRKAMRFHYWDSMTEGEGSLAWKNAKDLQAGLECVLQLGAGASFVPKTCIQQTRECDSGIFVCTWMGQICNQLRAAITSQGDVEQIREGLVEIVRKHDESVELDAGASISTAFMSSFVDYLSGLEPAIEPVLRRSSRLAGQPITGGDRGNPVDSVIPEALCLKLRQVAARMVRTDGFPSPLEELSPDFFWRPSAPGFGGRLLFSLSRKRGSFHCIHGCGEVHPQDWSFVSVLQGHWHYHCYPSLSAAVTKWDPDKKVMVFDCEVSWGESDYVKKSGPICDVKTLFGYDAVPRGYYRWTDALKEDDRFESAEEPFVIEFNGGQTFYRKNTEDNFSVAGDFCLVPIGLADDHFVLEIVCPGFPSEHTVGTFVIPSSLLIDRTKALAFLSGQPVKKIVLTWVVVSGKMANIWNSMVRSVQQRAKNAQRVTVSARIGWINPTLYVLSNTLQIVHETFLRTYFTLDWNERWARTLPFDSTEKWRIATAKETDYWVESNRLLKPKHPSLRCMDWQDAPHSHNVLLEHFRNMHSFVQRAWRTAKFPEGLNYPHFLLVQTYGLMALHRSKVAVGVRHFPSLVCCGERRRGKSTASQTLAASLVPHENLNSPLILGPSTTSDDVRATLGWLCNVPLVLDDTDSIKRDELVSLIQQYATGVADAEGKRPETCMLVNVNPERAPHVHGAAGRRMLRLDFVNEELPVVGGFDEQMSKFWSPLFSIVVSLLGIEYKHAKVDLLRSASWWKELLFPRIVFLYPDADETDHCNWLYFTILYGSLIGKSAIECIKLFALAFGLCLNVILGEEGGIDEIERVTASKGEVVGELRNAHAINPVLQILYDYIQSHPHLKKGPLAQPNSVFVPLSSVFSDDTVSDIRLKLLQLGIVSDEPHSRIPLLTQSGKKIPGPSGREVRKNHWLIHYSVLARFIGEPGQVGTE